MGINRESLAEEKCTPCHGGGTPLSEEAAIIFLASIDQWQLSDGKISKSFDFEDFSSALDFVNKVGHVAEELGHHPKICFTWGEVALEIWTHAINDLHKNDFILAAHIDKLADSGD